MPTAADTRHNTERELQIAGFNKQIAKLNGLLQHPGQAFNHFDWKLDFPEVLNPYLVGENGGFDIVIGNPPYLNVELMEINLKEIFKQKFEVFYKRTDIFGLFIDFSMDQLVRPYGKLAFIIPSIVLNNLSYKLLRNKILKNNWLSSVCYTGNKIFSDVTVDTVILLLNKEGVQNIKLIEALDFTHLNEMTVPRDFFEKFDNIISVSGSKNANNIFDKIFKKGNINIEQHFDVFQGIVTGNNPVFIFDEPEKWKKLEIEPELLKPLLHGRDFNKWIIKNTERRILYITNDIEIKNYPNAYNYLLSFKKELETSKSSDEKSSSWYCLHRPRVKSNLDLSPKIIIQNTRNETLKPRIVATVDEIGLYGSQGMNFVIPKTGAFSVYFIIGIINSKLIDYLFATKFLNLAIKADYIKQLSFPKPEIGFITELENITKMLLIDKSAGKNIADLEQHLNKMVYRLYDLSLDEVKVIDPEFSLSQTEYKNILIK